MADENKEKEKGKEKEKDSGLVGTITKSFDQYEYVAVITPGATLLLGLVLVAFEKLPLTGEKDIGLGFLGMFLIAAYVTGQFMRALGNGIEWALWELRGGLPTDWVVHDKQTLLDETQKTRLGERLKALLDRDVVWTSYGQDPEKWRGITRQVYAKVSAAGRSSRIDTFNRSYGMMLGLTVALLVLAALCWTHHLLGLSWPSRATTIGWLAVALAALTLYRAYLFALSYGRELFVQFLELPPKSSRSEDDTG